MSQDQISSYYRQLQLPDKKNISRTMQNKPRRKAQVALHARRFVVKVGVADGHSPTDIYLLTHALHIAVKCKAIDSELHVQLVTHA